MTMKMTMKMKINILPYGLLITCLMLSACTLMPEALGPQPEEQTPDSGIMQPVQPLIWTRGVVPTHAENEINRALQAWNNEVSQHSTSAKKLALYSDTLPVERAAETAPPAKRHKSAFFSRQERYHPLIERVSDETGLDAHLLHAMIEVESGYRHDAVSPKGAMGLMQLMPKTAQRFGAQDMKDPEHNVRAGASYMKWLLGYFDNNMKLALAGYNAGEGSVLKYGKKIPPYPETQKYVKTVLARYHQRKSEDNGETVTAAVESEKPKNTPIQPQAPSGHALVHNLLALLFSAPAQNQDVSHSVPHPASSME